MRLDPGNGNTMMGTNHLKKATDVLNDGRVASRLDGVVPEEAHAVHAVSDQVEASASGRGGEPVRDTNPLEGMIKSADFTGVVGRTEGPDPIRFGQVSNRGTPKRHRGSGGASQVNSPPGGPRRPASRAVRVKDRIRRKERGLA